MVTAIDCVISERIELRTIGLRNAAAYPCFCNSKRRLSTLPEASTASTSASATSAFCSAGGAWACAGAAAKKAASATAAGTIFQFTR